MNLRTSIIKKSTMISVVIVLFIFSCGGSVNPLIWKTQFERRVSPQMLIQPEKVAELYQEMGSGTGPYEAFEFVESKILYINDFFSHASLDHYPTAEEVVLSGKDDCDGHAILLCSVLRYAGYDAYTAIGPSHAWVEVETEETLFVSYYGGGNWYVRFNESSVEWRITSLVFLILEEFLFLLVFFSITFYAYERWISEYKQEVFNYLKYVFLFFFGYLLIGFLILFAKSTLWILWLNALLILFLLIVKIINKFRRAK